MLVLVILKKREQISQTRKSGQRLDSRRELLLSRCEESSESEQKEQRHRPDELGLRDICK
jgi:hypothetical protein